LLYESNRSLNKQERRLLREIISDCRAQIRFLPWRSAFPFLLVGVMAFMFMLWAGPFLAALAAILISCVITSCVSRSEKRPIYKALRNHEDALDYNQACEWRIQSDEVVVIGEQRSDRVVYAFQADEKQIVFVDDPISHGNDVRHFPSNDFSIVSILGSNGKAVINGIIHEQGSKLEPIRRISWKQLPKHSHPDHTEVIEGRLADLEWLLRKDNISS